MKLLSNLPTLPFLALFLLACAGTLAAVDHLNINITVTIAETNSIAWAFADANGDTTGDRGWALTGKLLSTACPSTAGTITGPASGAITDQTTALQFNNKGGIAVTATLTVNNGTNGWVPGAAAGLNTFLLKASTAATPSYDNAVNPSFVLSSSMAKNALCQLALQFTTPAEVSHASSAITATITAVQN